MYKEGVLEIKWIKNDKFIWNWMRKYIEMDGNTKNNNNNYVEG